jgi:hypothetical protein
MPKEPTRIAAPLRGPPQPSFRFAPDLASQDFGVDPSAGRLVGNHGKTRSFPVRNPNREAILEEPGPRWGRERTRTGEIR